VNLFTILTHPDKLVAKYKCFPRKLPFRWDHKSTWR